MNLWYSQPPLYGHPGGGGGYSHTLAIRVCAAQQGRDFEAPDLRTGYKKLWITALSSA